MTNPTQQPLNPRPIRVVEYDPTWPCIFAKLKAVIDKKLGATALSIEHVGSTSVPGLLAKPIIDLDVVIRTQKDLPQAIRLLEALGYKHEGDQGIPGRAAFDRPTDNVPQDGSGRSWPRHHLYVCAQDSDELARHLTFRNYLRTHPNDIQRYAALKRHLAVVYEHDREGYTEAKSEFIQSILAKAIP